MASFKSHPVFYSLLGALGLTVVAAGWCVYDRHAAAEKNVAQLSRKRSELSALQSTTPVPSDASKAAVEADVRRTEAALATMRAELKGQGPVAEALRNAVVPTEPTEVFFNLENFVEDMRRQARAAEIQIKDTERFGFYTHERSGPDRTLIPQVFRQRQVAEYLLKALFAAQPSELLSLHRERPDRTRPAAGASNQGNNDFFEIDPRISARVPGFVDATAFRLTFISETSSLRSLLNKLAEFELPLVVRSVEVEPTATRQAQAATPPANALNEIFGMAIPAEDTPAEPEPIRPLVEKILSKFTVTVELIDLVETPATEATPTN